MSFQPSLDFGMLMSGVVVGDEIKLFAIRSGIVEQSQKLDPLLMSMTLLAKADYFAASGVERGEQSSSPVRGSLFQISPASLAALAAFCRVLELGSSHQHTALLLDPED